MDSVGIPHAFLLRVAAFPCAWLHPDAGGENGRGVHQDHAEHRPPFTG